MEAHGAGFGGVDGGFVDEGNFGAVGGVDGEAGYTARGGEAAVNAVEADGDDAAAVEGADGMGTWLKGAAASEGGIEIVTGAAGQTHAETLQILSADVDAVVEGEVDGGDHAGVGDIRFRKTLGFLDLVPLSDVGRTHVAADLDIVEGEIGVAKVAPDSRDKLHEAGFEVRGGAGVGIGFALIPEDAFDVATGGAEAAEHGAVEALARAVAESRGPLLHGRPAVSAGDEADGNTGELQHIGGEGKAQAGAFLAIGDVGGEFFAGELFGLAFSVEGPVDWIDGVFGGVERLLGDGPIVRHVEGVDERVGRLDIDEVAVAFHVGLAGEDPEVAHEEVVDGEDDGGIAEADFDAIGSTGGDVVEGAGPVAALDAGEGDPIETGNGAGAGTEAEFDVFAVGFVVDGGAVEGDVCHAAGVTLENLVIDSASGDAKFLAGQREEEDRDRGGEMKRGLHGALHSSIRVSGAGAQGTTARHVERVRRAAVFAADCGPRGGW